MTQELTQEAHDAIHKAKNAQQAIEIAREQQTQDLADMVQERFEHVLSKGTEQEKSIILARVPYICQDIKTINMTLKEILNTMRDNKTEFDTKYVTVESFSPFKWGLTIVSGVILTTIVGALLAKILVQ